MQAELLLAEAEFDGFQFFAARDFEFGELLFGGEFGGVEGVTFEPADDVDPAFEGGSEGHDGEGDGPEEEGVVGFGDGGEHRAVTVCGGGF